jgi:hypothetical protein
MATCFVILSLALSWTVPSFRRSERIIRTKRGVSYVFACRSNASDALLQA